MKVTVARPADRSAVEAFLAGHDSLRVARRGELVSPLHHSALLAERGDELVGVATYVIDAKDCELLTLHARRRFEGIGTALVTAVELVARRAGCTRLWLVTTNDNVDALRFYQRRGLELTALRVRAVTYSRQVLKPEIPGTGSYGIELRDELELAKDLAPMIAD